MRLFKYIFLLLFLPSLVFAQQTVTPAGLNPATALTGSESIPIQQGSHVVKTTPSAILTYTQSQIGSPVSIANGGTGATTAQGGLNNIFGTGSYSIAPITAPCNGAGGDEGAWYTGLAGARAAKTVMLASLCRLNFQVKNVYTSDMLIAGWPNSPIDATDNFGTTYVGPINYASTSSIGIKSGSNTSPGAAVIDINAGVLSLNDVGLAGDSRLGATWIDNSGTGGGCCNNGDLVSGHNYAAGGANSFLGAPVSSDGQPLLNGGFLNGTPTNNGTGYTPGTYNAVPVIGGSGSGATFNTIVIGTTGAVTSWPGGASTYPIAFHGGIGYVVGDVVGVGTTMGPGSGASVTVSAVSPGSFLTAGSVILPRFSDGAIYDMSGNAFGGYSSDTMVYNTQISTMGYGFNPAFGGPNDQIANIRCEFTNTCFRWGMPYQSSGGGNDKYVQGFQATHNNGIDIDIEGGQGFEIANGIVDQNQTVGIPLTQLGGNAALKDVGIDNIIYSYQTAKPSSCIAIAASPAVSNLKGSIICDTVGGTNINTNIIFGQLPQHMILADAGDMGALYINTNPISLGTGTPHSWAQMAIDGTYLTSSFGLPVGTSGNRPASPVEGMLRDNTTIGELEAYTAGNWLPLGTSTVTTTLSLGTSTSLTNPAKVGDVTTGFYSDAVQKIGVAIGGVQEVYIGSTSVSITPKVGIGTATPLNPLDITAATGTTFMDFRASGASAATIVYADNSGFPVLQFGGTGTLSRYGVQFLYGGMRIDSSNTYAQNNVLNVNGNASFGYNAVAPSNGMIIAGNVGIGTNNPLATLQVVGTIKTNGYTVATLPSGIVGMRAYVTDQATSCPLAGAALTGSGSVVCPVFYNGSTWVGD